MTTMSDSLRYAVDAVQRGNPIILVDSPDREDEGDLVVAAERANYKNLSFLLIYSSRMLCVPMQEERLRFLGLTPVAHHPTKPGCCNFFLPVDARNGSTGLGIEDRLTVLDALLYDQVSVYHCDSRLSVPGHTFPLRTHPEGLLGRQGHTEGSVALMKLAGLHPAALIAEAWDYDRHRPLKGSYVRDFASEHHIPVVSIDEIVSYQSSLSVK